jgi:hypothetical protein
MQKRCLIRRSLFSMQRLVLFCHIVSILYLTRVHCDSWEYKLIHSVLRDYDSSIRPSKHHNSTLNVTFGLSFIQLIDVVSFTFTWRRKSFNSNLIKKKILKGREKYGHHIELLDHSSKCHRIVHKNITSGSKTCFCFSNNRIGLITSSNGIRSILTT